MEAAAIGEGTFEGQPAVILESAGARVVVLPRIGGKIASLVDATTGEELLWRNPERGYREPRYGDEWAAYDMSGWEDCLPTIAAGPYPDWPWEGVALPEQGEVWALPWEARTTRTGVDLQVRGVRLPYLFEKSVAVAGKRVHVRHRLTNLSSFRLRYLWAAHPLLAVRPGMRIVLPPSATRLRVEWSRDRRLGGDLDAVTWPEARDAQGRETRLDLVGEPTLGQADKLYTDVVREGWCGLRDPQTGRCIAFTFDVRRLPYLGVWLNYGAYPLEGTPAYNVALEPTCGYPDRLDAACTRGTAATIEPGQQQEWDVTMLFGHADSIQTLVDEAGEPT